MRTSAVSASLRMTSCPSGFEWLSVIERLLRLETVKKLDWRVSMPSLPLIQAVP